jgi:hypothetical protein
MNGTQIDLPASLGADERAWREKTASLMRAWRQQKEQLEATIADANARLAGINRKLEHAAGLLEDDTPSLAAAQAQAPRADAGQNADDSDEDSHAAVISAAIDKALAATPRGLRCGSLRIAVKSDPAAYERIKDHPNRFYSVLNRRLSKGRIVRKGKLYRLPSPDSPQGETGAVAAPVSH